MNAPSATTRRDLLIAFSAQVAYKMIAFSVLALMARYTTKDDFGQFMFVVALCSMVLLPSDLGTSNYLMREIASAPQKALALCRVVLRIRLPAICLLVLAVNLFIYIEQNDLFVLTLLISLFLAQKELYATFAALFVGLRRIIYTVIVFGGAQAALLIAVVVLAGLGAGIFEFAAVHALSGLCLVVLSYVLTRRHIGELRCASVDVPWREVLRASLPLFGLTALALLQLRVDTLMLGYLGTYTMVASYETAARLFEGSQFLVRPLTLILFPICSALVAAKRFNELSAVSGRLALGAIVLGIVVAATVIAGAESILTLMYGERYSGGESTLRALFLGVPALYLSVAMSFICVSLHLERTALLAFAISIVLNVVLNAYLIPAHGAQGAAYATLVSLVILASSLSWLCLSAVRSVRGRTMASLAS